MDQSRKLYIFGGHDGRRSLADLHIFDTESMNWSKAAVSGRPPVAGSRHTTTLAGDKLYVLGASDSGTFRDVHALDIETLTWSPVEAGGQPPIARSRHTSTLVANELCPNPNPGPSPNPNPNPHPLALALTLTLTLTRSGATSWSSEAWAAAGRSTTCT